MPLQISSQMFDSYHFALIGPPLIAIVIFCFGFVLVHQHAAAQLGSSNHSKAGPSAIQSSGGLPLITKPQLPFLSPVSTLGVPPNDPEDTVTPQLPNIANIQIQKADQRRQAAPSNGNSLSEPLLQQFHVNH